MKDAGSILRQLQDAGFTPSRPKYAGMNPRQVNAEAVVSERTDASGLSPKIAKAIQYARTDGNGPNAEMHR